MKYILLFLQAFLIVTPFSLSAAPDHCKILPNETRTADQILSACAAATIGVDPQTTSNDIDGVRERVQLIATSAISFGAMLAVGALVW
jgi:hypothetical protein